MDATTQLRRTASIGSVVAIGYPAAWVVALDAVRSTGLDDVSAEAPVGGGVPAVVATLALAVGLVLVIWSIRRKATDQTPWRKSGIVAFAAVYSTFLPVAFASLLPIVFPRLVL